LRCLFSAEGAINDITRQDRPPDLIQVNPHGIHPILMVSWRRLRRGPELLVETSELEAAEAARSSG
jgi:hypothetical protein